ncbi:hypothetical protein KBC89_00470 [Candidatus Woesebacteria bacterium]|nr:hypothetical protein [Candidatus Woesebacteria bacterium]
MTISISEVIMTSFAEMSQEEIAKMFQLSRDKQTAYKTMDGALADLRAQTQQRPDLLSTAFRDFRQRGQPATPEEEKAREVEQKAREAALDLEYFKIALGNFENALERARNLPRFNPDVAINQLVRHLSRLKDEARAKAIQEADQRYADSLFHEFWEQVKIGKGEGELSIYQIAKLKQDARLNSASIPYPQSQNPESDHVRGDDHTVAAQPRETSGVNTDKVLEIVSTAESFAGPISEALQEVLKDALTGL